MTPRYWIRIVLGMLAIFAVGMLITTGIRKGREKVEYVMEGTGPVTLPMLGLAFRLDDENLGGIERLRLLRSRPKQVDSAIVVVKLNDPSFASRFADCRLTVRDAENLNDKTSFFCADSATATALELVQFGHVEFMPTGETVAMWIPASVVADMRNTEIDGDASADTGDVDIQSGTGGGLSVKVNGQEIVKIDTTRAGLTVRDGSGRTIVRIRGDSSGAAVEVNSPAPPAQPRSGATRNIP